MQTKLIGYHHGETFLHHLSGAAKLLFFILVSLAAMITYDTRFLSLIGIMSLFLLRMSGIRFRDVSFVAIFALVFALLNVLMVYLFSPEYGVEIYTYKTLLFHGIGPYTLTSQELFYLLNLAIKYVCTIPLALIFLLTTHPSQFASSLNQIGVSYKIAYSVSLTLRYIPDLQEEFFTIKMSQEARGLELSRKTSVWQRIRGNLHIITPLIFSSLERIDTISTAMELRRFGKEKKRTWYSYQTMQKRDYLTIGLASLFLLVSLVLIWLNGGRFYNPWR
ncbi:Transmembrane component MtsC of energizing module of methionine-regulated ECF transporter [Streptococcus oralis]|uniref:Transmembrane component MtsC of energizing module of methionine-regulated ECF transporter n=1 Tax=Streptococcus oralis TaxID=1303 RepID=A0A139RPJ0_STROR|nr:energy-coupling factor transporter transmembrane component T [Streptococcus oralis]KXU16677.1 Transmembrane component MtsC of energizing module of methionine-regulated ECF transporter [Streptococcus oralis]